MKGRSDPALFLCVPNRRFDFATIGDIHHTMLPAEFAMPISTRNVVTLTQARANLTALTDEVNAGAEKIITRYGVRYVALIGAERLDYYHLLERERIHLVLIENARRGLADFAAGRTRPADIALAALRKQLARKGVAS
jgi:antitoxin (DNA-binding transcriptional repressor) of toxin-antitoxin stability system